MAEKTEFQAALETTLAGKVISTASGERVVLPGDCSLIDLESSLPAPRRSRGMAVLQDVESFTRFYNEQSFGTTAARIYGSVTPAKFTAVFNDDDARHSLAGFRDYRATYSCPLSVEWQTWQHANKKQMNQADFAQFIEDNLPDLIDGATLLEVSRTLQAKKKVNFASAIRLSDGQNQFTYEEEIQGTTSKGQLKVPETFGLGIPVFEGGTMYGVTARLRYRISEGGNLVLWYDLERAHKILEDAVKQVWTDIETATKVKIFNGSPAA